ncbi:MAG: dihydrofolate reductase [Deltaproteobacteria bacterium]|jgi:dihydrofolate reductase|nr:dihydrofolate reductase [Deltaproteobacteria bacterium]
MRVSLVVAAARNGAIGLRGEIPWRLPDDQRFFRRVTTGHAVVMGRKTFESIGRPLPNRENLVLTRRKAEPVPDVHFFPDLDSALAWAREQGFEECFVAGGEAVYREALECADRILLTRVEAEPEGDVFFPAPDETRWHCSAREPHPADERHAHAFAIETWERRN